MNPTHQLHRLGQSLWLDSISRRLLDDGTLRHYIDACSITGLTSNPSIFEAAITHGDGYDTAILAQERSDQTSEALFTELALEDVCRAADLFLPIHLATGRIDGWVSLEISPLLAHNTQASIVAALRLHAEAARANLLIKIPGTAEGLLAAEELIFRGVPINITLLFSTRQYRAAHNAFMRGIERRVEGGLDAAVDSVASLFVSRWDRAVNSFVSADLRNRIGIAIAHEAYDSYRVSLESPSWLRLAELGCRPQRLLWASTSSKSAETSATLYVEALVAPDTIDTIPEPTLLALVADGPIKAMTTADGRDAAHVRRRIVELGVDTDRLALRLQDEGVQQFVDSWGQLMRSIDSKRTQRRPLVAATA